MRNGVRKYMSSDYCSLTLYGCAQMRNGYLNKMVSLVVRNACFSLNTRFWQCLILIQQATALPRICTRVCVCWFGSHCFTQGSARFTERRRKMNNLRGQLFRFTTLEASVSCAKGIFKLRKIACLRQHS